jgi:light-regulated signal transduction histidine kinase (bacteriophytochrome)
LEEDARCLQDELAGSLDDTGMSYLDHMQQVLGQMNGLVDGLLSLSRYTHADMHFSSVDLSSLAAEILSGLQQQEPDREVKLTVQPHLQVNGDADMLRVMLEQLFNNAWKCTRHRSQTVLDFGARTEGGQKVFYLHDNGIGFDLALSGKLFIPSNGCNKHQNRRCGIGLLPSNASPRRH